MIAEWLIVLNADGTVLAVDGGVPAGWIGTRLEGRSDVPPEVREVAAGARRQLDESAASARMAAQIVATTAQRILVIVLSAMPVRRVATDLRALLESTIKVMELQARVIDVALTLDVGPDVPRLLLLDPAKMAWTITALIGNALRFVRRGTRLMPGGTIKVRARYEPAGSRVVLEVQDDGAGIRQQTLSELLHRPAGQLHSAGLALGLMQDVAAAHGGDVQLESSTEADRSGTTVRLTIPYH
jgi:signal transduction histidine kinase